MSCRCATLRETLRTDDEPRALGYASHFLEWYACRHFKRADDPWRGGIELCACPTCGARWEVYAWPSSSDNSPVPDTVSYEWRESAWTDAALEETLRRMTQFEADQKARVQAAEAERLARDLHLESLEKARILREQPHRDDADTWTWGAESSRSRLRVYDATVDYGSVGGHPSDGWAWTFDEFLADRPDRLPTSVYEEAAARVRAKLGR
jgi:hypothetical protein